MNNDIKEMFEMILTKLGGLEENQKSMEQKNDKNHNEVINKLKILENNQDAIKNYIFNSDDTFKKVEDEKLGRKS
ncbi:MAG: hypothetical protein ACREVX_00785 [Clostridium sp.]|uniref:hypothetical protein n=1 Tax=Clostridium sp. TaxID=1506 RepID=UPI003D6D5CC1